jgi:hypothetical protein
LDAAEFEDGVAAVVAVMPAIRLEKLSLPTTSALPVEVPRLPTHDGSRLRTSESSWEMREMQSV